MKATWNVFLGFVGGFALAAGNYGRTNDLICMLVILVIALIIDRTAPAFRGPES